MLCMLSLILLESLLLQHDGHRNRLLRKCIGNVNTTMEAIIVS